MCIRDRNLHLDLRLILVQQTNERTVRRTNEHKTYYISRRSKCKKLENYDSHKKTNNIRGISVRYLLSLIHISEPTRLLSISYAVFCLKKKKKTKKMPETNTPSNA